jgi:hypothetical protein
MKNGKTVAKQVAANVGKAKTAKVENVAPKKAVPKATPAPRIHPGTP